ncbi:TCR/Tet family MFS transporter [Maritimibacter sp. DP1N21-5]|uniref:TCR/Tet family MFS transporter n=1 Tax=Maritimibacter sp. DP1N21-5 TaxID=2836867 RepID=UPI001C446FCA|nr:TCR/Tet family MFS transporter [Maritimibacter sp. DP1N21-5]MBV7410407.1 TCR/Tet family MFS transporter [Maritimibacter sp. DP1N21-5]
MNKKPAVWFILATILIDAIGIGLIFPLMPDLMDRVGAGGAANGAVWGGVLMAAYAAMQFLFSPIMGALSDAFGRKPVLLFALFALALDYVLMALAGTLWLLVIGRVIAGIAGATHITATAYLADISAPEDRAANFGLIGATFGIGFVLGPALGGLLAGISVTAPFWVAAALAGLNVVFGLFVLPESLAPEKRRPFTPTDANPFATITKIGRLPGVARPLAVLFVFEFANMVYPTLWAFWGRAMFDWSATMIGASLAAYGVGVALTQTLVLPRLLRWLGDYRVLMVALVTGVLGAIGFGLAGAAWMVAPILVVACLSDMTPPVATGLMANLTTEDRQGALQGVIASLGSLAAVTAPIIMTPLFRAFAQPEAAVFLPGAPFLFAALLMAGTLPIAASLRPRHPAGPTASPQA